MDGSKNTSTSLQETISNELYELRYEIEESIITQDTFLASEQVIRFENLVHQFKQKITIDRRYENSVKKFKLSIYKNQDLTGVQKNLLKEIMGGLKWVLVARIVHENRIFQGHNERL